MPFPAGSIPGSFSALLTKDWLKNMYHPSQVQNYQLTFLDVMTLDGVYLKRDHLITESLRW